MTWRRLAGCLLGACVAISQAWGAGPEFEVASVRPSPPITPELVQSGRLRQGMTINAGRVDIAGIPFPALLSYAFRLPQNQITGPDWLRLERFDIQAKLPAGASEDQVPEMLQALLAERFKLTFHRENKEQPVFALTVAKGGLKVKESPSEAEAPTPPNSNAADAPPPQVVPLGGGLMRITTEPGGRGGTLSGPRTGNVRGSQGPNGTMHLDAPNMTFAGLADLLTQVFRQPVVDATELKGRYQIVVELTPPDGIDQPRGRGEGGGGVAGPAQPEIDPIQNMIVGALQKLGLRLESRKMPVETVVVDHMEKTPTEN